MELSPTDRRLIAALADGLPLVPSPYAAIGQDIGLSEEAVLDRLRALIDGGVLRRFGLVVRHHELGYQANAMVVWDVPDDRVAAIGRLLASHRNVTLCYRRPRRLPAWPYNLFCMIHGKHRDNVRELVSDMVRDLDLGGVPHTVLFSRRRFKQRGARYAPDALQGAA